MPWRMISAFWAYWGVVFFVGIVLPLSLMIAASGDPATIGEGIGELMQGALAAVLLYLVAIALSVFVSYKNYYRHLYKLSARSKLSCFFLDGTACRVLVFSCSLLGMDQAVPTALSFLSPLPLGAVLGELFWAHSKDQT